MPKFDVLLKKLTTGKEKSDGNRKSHTTNIRNIVLERSDTPKSLRLYVL